MIDFLAIDRWADAGSSWLHRASTPAKLLSVVLVVAVLVASRSAVGLSLVCAAVFAALLSSRLPLRAVLGLALAPVLMSTLFATTRLGGTWESAVLIVEKGAITSVTMLLLVCATPRTELFRALRRVLPRTIADMLLLAYRSAFILFGRGLETRQALQLRGNPVPWQLGLRRNAFIAGLTVIRANELAAEQYAAMRLRGYPGFSSSALAWRGRPDAVLLAAVGAVALVSLAVAPSLPPPGLVGTALLTCLGALALRIRHA
ncbi:MAG: hypothetical protein HY534_08410 [Chloroflexi bacterium]|nr:hypothetical protein [Chloroflexota bacterium]